MSSEVHALPPAPRRVRWRAVLGHRFLFAFAGFMLAIYGGAIGLMFLWHRGGKLKDDFDLDARALTIVGKITSVEPTPVTIGGARICKVRHVYRPPKLAGFTQEGEAFAREGTFTLGDDATIEYLDDRTEVSRVRGARISLTYDPGPGWFRFVLVPGICCWLAWLVSVLRLRRLLAHGDVALAEILAMRPVRVVIPGMLLVRYSFRDRNARQRTSAHWVREHGALARRLAADPRRVTVVHDRRRPRRSHLAIADDFAAPPATLALVS